MCGVYSDSVSACCPQAQIVQEEICGNINGVLTADILWSAPAGSYISGTFQVFNSASSTGNIVVAGDVVFAGVTPGNTQSESVDNPTTFTVTALAGVNGTYCITLYKRILA
ncbi:S-Ena type endospore appendage [Halobacillus kuroshimensis]|uniref:S-Ena type endospore appendage n=1 Tax=Halobacillus kuroshimensis TaxID=302481 RepID=UPI00048709F2|nr:S-Ena type endospore appendage [Halobacillus kuroshimensis]